MRTPALVAGAGLVLVALGLGTSCPNLPPELAPDGEVEVRVYGGPAQADVPVLSIDVGEIPSDGGYLDLIKTRPATPQDMFESQDDFWVDDDRNVRAAWVKDIGMEYEFIEAGLRDGLPFRRTLAVVRNRYAPTIRYMPNGDILLEGIEKHEDPSRGTFVWLRHDGGTTDVTSCANGFDPAINWDPTTGDMLFATAWCRGTLTCREYEVETWQLFSDGGTAHSCAYLDGALNHFAQIGFDRRDAIASKNNNYWLSVKLDGGVIVEVTEQDCKISWHSPTILPIPSDAGSRYLGFGQHISPGYPEIGAVFGAAPDGGCDVEWRAPTKPDQAMPHINNPPVQFRGKVVWGSLHNPADGGRKYPALGSYDPETRTLVTLPLPVSYARSTEYGHFLRTSTDGGLYQFSTHGARLDGGGYARVRRVVEADELLGP